MNALQWKNRIDDFIEAGGQLSALEEEMLADLTKPMATLPKVSLEIIERRDEGDGVGRAAFHRVVAEFLSTHRVRVVKFQRNLFFDVAGSDPLEPKPRKLVQEYVAFIVWEES